MKTTNKDDGSLVSPQRMIMHLRIKLSNRDKIIKELRLDRLKLEAANQRIEQLEEKLKCYRSHL